MLIGIKLTGYMNDLSNRLIFLTGATGFVGTHTARVLLETGYRVRCLVRPTSDRSRLLKEAELVEGHLNDTEALRRAVEGCWGVMHIGGVVRVRDTEDFYRTNRDGTANLVKASREAGVERFLLCSSQAASGPSTVLRRRQADDPPAPVTEYGKSKLAGERTLQDDGGDMWYAIIRPPAVYGPYDVAFLSFVRWVKYGVKIRLGSGEMPFALIHVEDLARALTLAISADHPSGAIWYATDGIDHSLNSLGIAVEAAVGKKAIWITIPSMIAPMIASAIEKISKLRGETALLSRQKLLELTQPAWTCDDTPLRKAVGYKERFDLSNGIAQTVEWYRKEGWI